MSSTRTGEPRTAGFVTWLVLAASFILSADTWHALGVLAGFGDRLSWLMPVSVDGYVTVALILWTAPVPAKVARFARTNTYFGAGVGVTAQSSFHALTIYSATGYDWRVYLAAVVGALPPAVAGLAVHMRSLVRRESALRASVVEREPAAVTVPAVAPVVPAPAPVVEPEPVETIAVEPEHAGKTTEDLRPSRAHGRASGPGPGREQKGGRTKVQTMRDYWDTYLIEQGHPPTLAEMDRAARSNGMAKKYRPAWLAEWLAERAQAGAGQPERINGAEVELVGVTS